VEVAIGIDTHKASLAAGSVDALGRVLDVQEFTNDPAGHRLLVRWVREQAHRRRIGIEGSLNYGASVARTLLESGEDVREVSPMLTHVERRRRAKGKSDPIDAVAIARVVAADDALPSAKRTALLFDLKLLVDYRDQLVRARTQLANRVHADLVVIRPGYEKAVPNLRARRHVLRTRSLISRDRSVQAELVRRRLGDPPARDRDHPGGPRNCREASGDGHDPHADPRGRTVHRRQDPGGGGRDLKDPVQGLVRVAFGDGAADRVVRSDAPAPAKPKGEPSAQLVAALHRARPSADHPGGQGVPGPAT